MYAESDLANKQHIKCSVSHKDLIAESNGNSIRDDQILHQHYGSKSDNFKIPRYMANLFKWPKRQVLSH